MYSYIHIHNVIHRCNDWVHMYTHTHTVASIAMGKRSMLLSHRAQVTRRVWTCGLLSSFEKEECTWTMLRGFMVRSGREITWIELPLSLLPLPSLFSKQAHLFEHCMKQKIPGDREIRKQNWCTVQRCGTTLFQILRRLWPLSLVNTFQLLFGVILEKNV